MKTYIVMWFNKTKNGAIRDYRKVIQTDNIKSYISDKMKLVVGCMAFGHHKGTFLSATEVCKTDKLCYNYQSVEGGEYWFTHDGNIECGICQWSKFYDYNLKSFLLPQFK